jgi:tRNA-dihydrouridine synthase B
MPAIQAALSGFSDRPMRMVARRFGAAFAMAEVVLDEHVVLKGKLRTRLLEIGKDDHPIGGQLMGSRPEQFAEAAHELVEGGYDLIDLGTNGSDRRRSGGLEESCSSWSYSLRAACPMART